MINYSRILFVEEGIASGGIGEHLRSALEEKGFQGMFRHVGLPSLGVSHASVDQLRRQFGLDAQSLLDLERGML